MTTHHRPEWATWDSEYVWHPYTQMQLVPDAIPVERAQGAYLYLTSGERVIDSISSWWLTLHGHSHPAIARAIAEQAANMEHVIFAGFTHRPAAELAHKLIAITPEPLQKVFFSDNGSTAVEVALKMCIQYWRHHGERRNTFLALEHAYHGDTFGAMSVSEGGAFTAPFHDHLFDVKRLPFPAPPEQHDLSANATDLSAAETRFLDALQGAVQDSTVAGFIYEPLLLGAGGMLTWRPYVLQLALQIVGDAGVLAIADEVLTGFGRTGTMFASERAAMAPDLMTLSKGITGGFLPMGVTLATRAIFETFLSNDRARTFFHGHSYTGNPITCAAAVASLEVFSNEPVRERINEITASHAALGAHMAARHPIHFRQVGTVAAFAPLSSAGYLSTKSLTYSHKALQHGVLLRPLGDVLYVLPPYCITRDDLEEVYQVIDQLLSET